jgi:hypothetical protein
MGCRPPYGLTQQPQTPASPTTPPTTIHTQPNLLPSTVSHSQIHLPELHPVPLSPKPLLQPTTLPTPKLVKVPLYLACKLYTRIPQHSTPKPNPKNTLATANHETYLPTTA